MAVKVYWQDEAKTIVRYDFEGNWTWEELYPEYHKAIAMEKSQPHRVDVIIDMRRGGHPPMNLLTHVKSISDKQPDNIGLSIIVTNTRFLISLYQVGCKIHKNIQRYFAIARTDEEALAMIIRERDTLPSYG